MISSLPLQCSIQLLLTLEEITPVLLCLVSIFISSVEAFHLSMTNYKFSGWGSGASLVSLLMASPITNPKERLFKRAILLDGTALSPWAMSEDPQGAFLDLAAKLNVGHIFVDCYRYDLMNRF